MEKEEKQKIIEKAKIWMKETILENHKKNTLKLIDIAEFNINPFLLPYLGFYFKGNIDFKTLAKVLVYPRVLGTSITTSFGQTMQNSISTILGGFGSGIEGIDIEFIDKIDGRKKYAQIKAGPNVINKDDVDTIDSHFRAFYNRSRVNNLQLQNGDLVFCLLYGESSEKNSFIKKLEENHPVYMGKDFWLRLTGGENFYKDLIKAMGEVAKEVNMEDEINEVINKLAIQIEEKYKDIFN